MTSIQEWSEIEEHRLTIAPFEFNKLVN